MISTDSEAPVRAARKRRAMPRRPVWRYVFLAVVVLAISVGGGWAVYSGRFAGLGKANFLSRFSASPAIKSPADSRGASDEAPLSKGREKVKGHRSESAKAASRANKEASSPEPRSPESLRAENADMRKQLEEMAPKGFYVVINTAGNRVTLHNGDKVEADMIASCGSGNVLEDPKGGRRWTFDTPRGVFTVKTKVANPVWIKPDWAFIEEGEPIPKDRAERAEPGMMGDFAVGIGDGYYMHGTLYKRLLGRNVSHGCVRLGDADIERLYHTLAKGDRVYIF